MSGQTGLTLREKRKSKNRLVPGFRPPSPVYYDGCVMKRTLGNSPNLFGLFRALCFAGICHVAAISAVPAGASTGIRVQGPGSPPQIEFACCDRGIEQMQSLFADGDVIASLNDLHAQVAIAILDFTPVRADLVHRLNQAGIPVTAWILLSKAEGYYLNADNAPAAAARVAAFEDWTSDNGLKWAGLGLDIEPNFAVLGALKTHRRRLIAALLRRGLNGDRIAGSRQAYSKIIAEIQSRGYPVQTYQMPYIPAERSVHSSLLDRLLGTVDVRGNEEYLMLYTNVARPVGAGMIWSLGRDAEAISIGSTDGDTAPGRGAGPLNWDEFSRDLIVASHFSRQIGVYNLEGCVRQGFLLRLKTMDWSQSVVIPEESVRRAERLGIILRTVLWIGSNLLYLIFAALALLAWLIRRWHIHQKKSVVK